VLLLQRRVIENVTTYRPATFIVVHVESLVEVVPIVLPGAAFVLTDNRCVMGYVLRWIRIPITVARVAVRAIMTIRAGMVIAKGVAIRQPRGVTELVSM
jgi:hypothetical protein